LGARKLTNGVLIEDETNRCFATLTSFSTANIRTIRKHISNLLVNASGKSVHNLALALLKDSKVPRFFVYELIQHHSEAFSGLNSRLLKRLGSGIQSWSHVDAFACYLSGPAWREKLVPDELIISWADSQNRWWRRAAVVSTVPLNNKTRGGGGDIERTLMICRLVVDDRDDMVVKALSWALRELIKREPEAVKHFLNENRTMLAARVVREVNNKLNTGLKNPRQLK